MGASCGHDHHGHGHDHGHDVRALDAPLTAAEQRAIAGRLGPLLLGVGLLGLGWVYGRALPDQRSIAAVLQALAALLVSLPILRVALRGFLARPTFGLTEQLVAIAILAAAATGDFVTATLVPLFLELGHLFEERSSRGARAAIDGIRRLSARSATRVDGAGDEVTVGPETLREGDVVLVRPGETIPVDGDVVEGRSSVDQASITGESKLEDVGPGSRVYAGTVNLDGLLRLEATRVGGGTVLGRVLDVLRDVEASKTPVLRLLERYAAVYLPIVLAVAGATLFLTGELDRAIAVLIVSCPCALVLAGPAAMVAAMTASTRRSMLIKSPEFLEAVAEIDTLILDKTGTITTGALSLDAVHALPGVDRDEVLAAAASCGHGSMHPVSRAAVEAAGRLGVPFERRGEVTERPGDGVEVRGDGDVLRLGRRDWLGSLGLGVADDVVPGGAGAWVARGDRVLGFIALQDRARPEAAAALAATRRLGIERAVLLTGDRAVVAHEIAAPLGFDEVVADVLPEQKLDVVRAEQAAGRRVMMVGDGVNDALALSAADVGVAVGARVSEVALGGADVALMSPDLGRLPEMLRLADFTRGTVVLNAILGVGFSLSMMGLASVGLIPPLVGALLHNAGSLLVLLNSARIVRFVEPDEARGPFIAPGVPFAVPA